MANHLSKYIHSTYKILLCSATNLIADIYGLERQMQQARMFIPTKADHTQYRIDTYSAKVGRILTEEQCDLIDNMAATTTLSIDGVLHFLCLVYRMDNEIIEATYSKLVLDMQYLQQHQPPLEPKWWHGLEHIIQRHLRRRARARTQEAHSGRNQASSDTWWTYTCSKTRHRRFTRTR